MVQALLEGGVEINEVTEQIPFYPLACAVAAGALNFTEQAAAVVEYLVTKGADKTWANPTQTYHLFSLAESSCQMVQLLTGLGSDGPLCIEALLTAVRNGTTPALVRSLLAAGLDPHACWLEGSVPLSAAVDRLPVQPGVVEALLQGGADPNYVFQDRCSNLVCLVLKGSGETEEQSPERCQALKLLLQWGAKPVTVSREGVRICLPLLCVLNSAEDFPSFEAAKAMADLLYAYGATTVGRVRGVTTELYEVAEKKLEKLNSLP